MGLGRKAFQNGRRRHRRGSFQTRGPGSGNAAWRIGRGEPSSEMRAVALPVQGKIRRCLPASAKLGQAVGRCRRLRERLSQCSELLSGLNPFRSPEWGVLNPRAPSAPVTADVPLRCIPTTKSHEPLDRSEVVPRKFGLLMAGRVSAGVIELCPAPRRQAGPRKLERWPLHC